MRRGFVVSYVVAMEGEPQKTDRELIEEILEEVQAARRHAEGANYTVKEMKRILPKVVSGVAIGLAITWVTIIALWNQLLGPPFG